MEVRSVVFLSVHSLEGRAKGFWAMLNESFMSEVRTPCLSTQLRGR